MAEDTERPSYLKPPTVARTWDSIPPILFDGPDAISTRVLEKRHRECHAVAVALREWIDSIPKDFEFPFALSGVDRDWVDSVLERPI
jgi:hypothetical protein